MMGGKLGLNFLLGAGKGGNPKMGGQSGQHWEENGWWEQLLLAWEREKRDGWNGRITCSNAQPYAHRA
jgi:hypothetical protein